MDEKLVLVTGGSGFVGAHCILALLAQGHRVRTTVRRLRRADDVRAMLAVGGANPAGSPGAEGPGAERPGAGDALSFVAADLRAEEGWAAAVEGCDYVLHVASPFPLRAPKHEDELIRPARDGALRVLRAARDGGVKRVVLTSSFAAVGYGTEPASRTYTEADWSEPDGELGAYAKSKTLAERAAWHFIESEGANRAGAALELATVNPVAIYGPVLGPGLSTSVELVRRLLDGALPGVPRVASAVVDVRDVADLHLLAMTSPAAAGERFLASAGAPVAMPEMARMLRERLGAAAAKVPTRVLPDWTVRLGAVFVPDLKEVSGRLGKVRDASSAKAREVLRWDPRSSEEALLATAESLIRLRLL